MRWNHLLFWMTQAREGGWAGFKGAVQSQLLEGEDSAATISGLRLHFSEFGDADFFVGETRRWQVQPPVLAAMEGRDGEALLVGGRTRALIDRLAAAVDAAGCGLAVEGHQDGPSVYRLRGPAEALTAVAAAAGIRFVPGIAGEVCAQGIPVTEYLRRLQVQKTPPNWTVTSFDFSSMSMREGPLRNAACECKPRHGLSRWYLQLKHGLIQMPKRDAIYAAAMLQRVPLLEYSHAQRTLAFRPKAPMPELYTRAACLCAGRRARFDGGKAVFSDIPPKLAAVLCAATGQPFPQS